MNELMLGLLLAHFTGDFLLQPSRWVEHKESKKLRSKFFYLHLVIHFLLIILFTAGKAWLLGLLVVLFHAIIDIAKVYFQSKKYKVYYFFGDQFLHLLSIIFVVTLAAENEINVLEWLFEIDLLLLLFLIVISFVSSVSLKVLLTPWHKKIKSEEKSLPAAGKWIGILERLLVFTFVCLGQWPAVGFLITAKSVLRFGDLNKGKNRKLTEYILVGTLLSFSIAIFAALAYININS